MVDNRRADGCRVCAAVFLVLFGSGCVVTRPPVTVTCTLPDGVRVLAECRDIRAAQMKLRELKRAGKLAGPVEVVLRKGVYSLPEPLRFTPEDSGTAQSPVTYRAEAPGTVTLSGGVRISGWRPESNGVWRADVPEARADKLYFRQMFIDGRRAVRARSPNKGFFHTTGWSRKTGFTNRQADGFYFDGDDVTADMASPDTMVVLYQSWLSRQHTVKEIRPEAKAVFVEPVADSYRFRARYLVENSPVCLDAPGEWQLDRQTGTVRYLPLPGEDMRKATVMVPVTPSLLQFKGDPERGAYVEHLRFHGFVFSYADWTPQGRSITGGQARCPTGFATPDVALESGAVSAIGLRNTSLQDCEITRVGAHAVVLMQGCFDNLIQKCHLHDLGGGGVYLFWEVPGSGTPWKPRGEFDHIERNVIDNCYIHDMTHVFNGSVGVLTGPCAAYNRITHNEISHGDYTGVSVGWGWTADKKTGQYQEGNAVEYNHIHHMMNNLLDDGGGIYLLGWQKGARIRRNWIHDVRPDLLAGGAEGLYPDSGVSGVLFEGNIVHDVMGGFAGNGGHECVVRDNIFAFCQISGVRGGGHWWDVQVRHNPNPVLFERNIVYGESDAALMRTGYRPDAQVSRDNVYWAGAERAGAKLFSGAALRAATFAEWQAKGHDAGSVMADPLFVDAAGRDLRLRPGSPALKIGFKQTDMSEVGLYGDRRWKTLPGKMKHAPIWYPPGPGGFEWTYEDETAGVAPTRSGQLAMGPKRKIAVTDADAASGKHSLMLTEGSHMHSPIGVDTGAVKASLRIKLPRTAPATLYLEFRDHRNPGIGWYKAGPHLQIDAQGVLTATKDAGVKAKLPRDAWVLLEMSFAVGKGKAKTFDLTVTVPGQSPQIFRNVPFGNPDFAMAGHFYLVNTGRDGAFLFDDVRVSISQEGK